VSGVAADRSAAKPACLCQQVKHSAKCICYWTGSAEFDQSLQSISLVVGQKVLSKKHDFREKAAGRIGVGTMRFGGNKLARQANIRFRASVSWANDRAAGKVSSAEFHQV
jgi:hypothetical protein